MPRPKSDTRQRILHAAMHLFWENGYAATGIAELLKKANANSGSFYYFFDGKEDLLGAVLDEYLDNLDPVIVQPVFRVTPDPLERIFGILAGYRAKLLDTDCTYGCPIGRLALEIDPADKGTFKKISSNLAAWVDVIARLLEDVQDQLPGGTNLHELAQFVLVTMEGGVMLSRSHRSIEPFDAAVRQLGNYFALLLEREAEP